MTKKFKALFMPAIFAGFLILLSIFGLGIGLEQRGWDLGTAIVIPPLFGGFWFVLYFLPSFIAGVRNAPNYLIILGINLVFGWTIIGWIAALIWAIIDKNEKPVIVHQTIYQNNPESNCHLPPRLPPS